MSGVNRHPRLPRPVSKTKTGVLDELLLWSVPVVAFVVLLAYLGVFDGLVGR